MAAGVITNFLVQTPTYFPLMFQQSPCREDDVEEEDEKLEEKPEQIEDEDEREEDEEDDGSEVQEEEEEECLEEGFLNPALYTVDVTKQLLTFADLISRDVQRYFGRCSGDREACDIYSDSVSVATSGRLRYYDDLLRIARAGSPEEQDNSFVTCSDYSGVAKGNSSLGPLAELFDHMGPSQSRGQPMVKRHLPLSFWTEPMPCCPLVGFSDAPDVTDTHMNGDASAEDSASTDTDAHVPFNALAHHNTHTLDNNQPDFSDLLANWDPNPELTHTLTENMQH